MIPLIMAIIAFVSAIAWFTEPNSSNLMGCIGIFIGIGCLFIFIKFKGRLND